MRTFDISKASRKRAMDKPVSLVAVVADYGEDKG